MKKFVFIGCGSLAFCIGTLGLFLPFIPTVPFYMLTGFFYFRSSDKLYQKFIHSTYYEKYIRNLLIEKNITTMGLVKMFAMILLLFLIPAILVDNLIMRICLAIIYCLHVVILTWYLKIKKPSQKKNMVGVEKVYD